MILVADSGSTKTTWCLINPKSGKKELFQTAGINPFYQDEATIVNALRTDFETPQRNFEAIYFYSAGCANPVISKVAYGALNNFFNTNTLKVESDLMAAAHALCGTSEGIACILGTGSNSCHYNGSEVVENVSPLGFILGDEGSGAVIGKKLLSDILKKQLPENVRESFFRKYRTDSIEILENIYKKPFPNRYAAGFTKFLSENKSEPSLRNLVLNAFDEFITRNVLQYKMVRELPVHFTGSVAFFFSDLLDTAMKKHRLKLGNIIKDPINGLIDFHLK
jgi:N-acetylglucosamine kinase-like BadF-type ATPase